MSIYSFRFWTGCLAYFSQSFKKVFSPLTDILLLIIIDKYLLLLQWRWFINTILLINVVVFMLFRKLHGIFFSTKQFLFVIQIKTFPFLGYTCLIWKAQKKLKYLLVVKTKFLMRKDVISVWFASCTLPPIDNKLKSFLFEQRRHIF